MPSTLARPTAGLVCRAALAVAVAAAGLVALSPAAAYAQAADAPPATPPAAAPAAPPADAAPPTAPPAAPSADAGPAATQPYERFPEPNLSPTAWELKFTHGTPKRIVVRSAGDQGSQAYWYMTYTVANLGEQDVDFDPVFELLTEDGKTHRATRAVPADVFDAIKRKEGNKLLESPRKVAGMVRPGEEQARDSVAVWKEPAREMGTFTVFVAGLSGEVLTVKRAGDRYVPVNLKTAAEELKDVKEEDRMHLRKQYSVKYRVLGDQIAPGNDPIQKRESRWVMRP